MKIRSGFVSNSSSSSFLIYGFKVENGDDLYDELCELSEEMDLWKYVHNYYDEDAVVVGEMLANVEGIKTVDIDFSNLKDKKEKVCDIIKEKSNIDLSEKEFKFIMGEVYS